MEFEQFSVGIAWTKNEWGCDTERRQLSKDFHYESLRKRGDNYWLHLERMSEAELGEKIITRFLNTPEWMCRIHKPDSTKGKEVLRNLKRTVDRLPEYYAALESLRIEDTDFQAVTFLKGTQVPVLLVVAEIYATFCEIIPRFGPVSASKLMHMALPNLFIMWDDAIIKEYHVPSYPSDKPQYVTFLILMQETFCHIKETHPAGSNITNRDLIRQINEQFGYADLSTTRLLDIANYAVGHPEKWAPNIKCKRCCERANARLDGLEAFINQYPGFEDTKLGRFRCS